MHFVLLLLGIFLAKLLVSPSSLLLPIRNGAVILLEDALVFRIFLYSVLNLLYGRVHIILHVIVYRVPFGTEMQLLVLAD